MSKRTRIQEIQDEIKVRRINLNKYLKNTEVNYRMQGLFNEIMNYVDEGR